MSSRVKYHPFGRNTLLEELQSILHEYPDNEQIIKELLQNAEDAGARVVKIGFCPSSKSDHLPDAYRKYLSGPALCFYNDSVFEEKDWEGLTMVRKSDKQDNPLKIGKFGIGFKSVFHVTDTVCVVSGRKILFIDPLCELQDPLKVCSFMEITDYVHQDVCGQKGLKPLYNLFGISEETIRSGEFKGTLFWFPLRNSPSDLSENVYTLEKIADLLKSFKEEIGSELLFLTSVENIGVYKINNGNCETEYSVALDGRCAEKARKDRDLYKTTIRDIEEKMADDDQWIFCCGPVWMKSIVTYQVKMDEMETSQKWLIIQNFHTGSMNNELSSLIRNRRSKYRPYIGIAARLDEAIQSGQIFCFLPLPFENESSTGLPVHINGFFALDSNRQHLKWPSQDQVVSESHLENDMLWNLLMVQEILPIVYKEFLKAWRDDSLGTELTENYLEMFYHHIPRMSAVKNHWACVGTEVHNHVLQSEIPCLHKGQWIKTQEAYYSIFSENTNEDVKNTVIGFFENSTKKVIILQRHEDLFHFWKSICPRMKCTDPRETRNLLRRDYRYKQLGARDKGHLLIYSCSDEILSDLNEIELLPLHNDVCQSFEAKRNGHQKSFYLCEKEEFEILIGKEECLVMNTSSKLGKVLKSIASSGHYSFQRLHQNTFFQFLNEVVYMQCKKQSPFFVKDGRTVFGELWLKKVWRYLKIHCPASLDPVKDLWMVKTKESYILKKISDSFISETNMAASSVDVLGYFKIWIVDMAFHDHPLFAPGKGVVVDCTDDGKRKLLQRCIKNGISSFNTYCSGTMREWFKDFLPITFDKGLASSVKSLAMFKCYSSTDARSQIGYTSLEQCREVYVGDQDFPIPFHAAMILPGTQKEERLLSELSAVKVDLGGCTQECIRKVSEGHISLNDENLRRFCFYVIKKQPDLRNWRTIQKDLNSIRFIKNGIGKLCSANELYYPSDSFLNELFLLEHKFPEEDGREIDLLRHLQFQRKNSQAFQLDVVHTCHLLDSKVLDNKSNLRKSYALLQVFRQSPSLLKSVFKPIYRFKILPSKQERSKHYPKTMEWYSDSMNLVSLEMVYNSRFECVVGSVLPVPAIQWDEYVDITKRPPFSAVINHFGKIIQSYSEDEHAEYSYIMKEVYQFLAKEYQNFASLLPQRCILTEFGFMRPTDIYLDQSKTDLDLEPYFIPLPRDYKTLRELFKELGCKKNQSSFLLVETLHKIKKEQSEMNYMTDINQDLDKVETILKKLSECSEGELFKLRDAIIVPIHSEDSNILIFRHAQECAYSDSDWFSRTFTDEDKICLIHSKIDKEIAKKLGVKSLKKFTLSDAEELCSEFGQSEPLTQRLNNLLEEGYTDGLSVPKELIQNADDAGASEVYFLYDERENEDAKSCLLDAGMERCQGPALWVFNNAVFSPTDFENIQKLSRATKKDDTTKIGKFGLGFNAVYNLTDVPSFASGKYLIYLDPQRKYLGEAILHENSPGIKLNLHNKIMLRKLENQFKPFQNVFGFNSSKFSRNDVYNGTLFRFPLRTKQQALGSEISSKEYSQSEMEKLMKLFCKACGNMLLFTQNINKIKIFHVGKNCTNPDKEMELVLTVTKEEDHQQLQRQGNENILTAVSRHCSSLVQHSGFLFTCVASILFESKGHTWVDITFPFKEKTDWIISWAVGVDESLRLFRDNKSDGALPLSSVAVPVNMMNNGILALHLDADFNRYGFYNTGHLFCYLPLPIETTLNFHVNGNFAVSSDRQRILIRSEDDKDNTKQTIWNCGLVCDATLEAILELLKAIKIVAVEDYSFFALWPTQTCDSFWQTFKHEFYQAILRRNLPLLKTHCGWKTFQECMFLHSDIECDKRLKETALDILKSNPLYGKIVTEIPTDVYREFESHIAVDFRQHIITYETFIIECFLPNISSYQGKECDEIVLGAIRSKNKNILDALMGTNCISTSTNELRREPRDLVHPRSSVSGLFLVEDERFPIDIFCLENDLEILARLGMMKDEIPSELLESQTRDMINLSKQCWECGLHRSMEIMKYVHHMYDRIPESTKQNMSNMPFLPVKSKPCDWPIKWQNESLAVNRSKKKCAVHYSDVHEKRVFFENPGKLFFPRTEKLVGSTQKILGKYEMYMSYFKELRALGVKTEEHVRLEMLKLQLTEITREPKNAENKTIEDMCDDIYAALEKRLLSKTKLEAKYFIQDHMSNVPCILTEKTFAFPKQVVLALPYDCSPYLFCLKSKFARHFPKLMETLGVRKFFEPEEVLAVLAKIKDRYTEKKLPANELQLVCRITNVLENFEYVSNDTLFLPDIIGFFFPVHDLCLDDCSWLPTTESMNFLNTEITLKVAKLVGIKSKREQNIFDESEGFGDAFGQQECLTNRIKRILDGYPEINIMKELLQNADDAGATKLHFIKDFRIHRCDHVFSENWKELQGPALCVFNDSVFTDKDIEGIQNLGIGSKGDDPMATGQYGVGFNVVYHLTDVPSFLTRDCQTSQDTLCVLDPHCRYIPHASEKKPGRKFRYVSKNIKQQFKDILPCYFDESELWKSSSGTLFRFPLRCNKESLLSSRLISCEDIEKLLNELKNDMGECLLFLRNVDKIMISSVDERGLLVKEFEVSAKKTMISPEIRNTIVHNTKQKMKENAMFLCSMDRKESIYYLQVNINEQVVQEWLIVTGFGFHNKDDIPETIKEAYRERRLALLPSAGIAIILKNMKITYKDNKKVYSRCEEQLKFGAYCFLPLPIETGLPVHINGHFALDHEARHNIYWPDNESADLKITWNKTIIKNVIVPTYAIAIEHLRNVLFPDSVSNQPWDHLDIFHRVFPSMKSLKDKVWQYAAAELYRFIKINCKFFSIVHREYQSIDMSKADKTTAKPSEVEEQIANMPAANTIIHDQPLKVTWTTLQCAIFDDIRWQLRPEYKKDGYYYTYGKSQRKLHEDCSKESEFLAGCLKDLGMLLIETPLWVFSSMKDAGIENVQTVSPKVVLQFLKTYKMGVKNRCVIEKVDIPVTHTRMRNTNVVISLLYYCVRDKLLTATDFEHVPLLLTADNYLREFRNDCIIYLAKFPNLLPKSTNVMAHLGQIRTLESFSTLQIFVKKVEIGNFAKLLCNNISSAYCTKVSKVWNQKSDNIPNVQWMKCFWAFIAQNSHSCVKEEQAKSKDTKVKEECEKAKSKDTKTEEECLKDFATNMLMLLGEWNFVPALVKRNSEIYDCFIFSLSHGKNVFRPIFGECSDEQDALKGLDVPLLDERCLPSFREGFQNIHYLPALLQSVVSTVKNVKDILDCLYLNSSRLNRTRHHNCLTVLEYFGRNLKTLQENSHSKERLASLPLYYDIFHGCVSVQGENVIILPDSVPKEGLKEWSRTQGILLIKEERHLTELYLYVGCRNVTDIEFYINCLLPGFHGLPPPTVMFHMKYIKDVVRPSLQYKSKKYQLQQKQLDALLQKTPFLPTGNDEYACACEFFNPHKSIFQVENRLCKPSELPPKPFNDYEWEDFLIHCGMKSEFTPEIFLEIANRLQELGNMEGITAVVQENSENLVRILFCYDSNLRKSFPFMNDVKHIRFLCPHPVSKRLTKVVPQHDHDRNLICFQKSTSPSNELLCWSTMKLVSEMTRDAMKVLPKNDQVREALELYETPPMLHVVNHVKNVCSSRNQLSELIARSNENENTVTKIMSHVYLYLQQNMLDIPVASLREVPFIFIKNRKVLTIPQRVVLNMNEDEEIPPYLYKAPVYFGQYQSVFQACGAVDTLLCKHLANVLHEIYVASEGNVLEPNERKSTKMAMQQLFRKLKVEKGSEIILPLLYLPSKNHNLVRCDEMVFVDDQLIEQRIGSCMPDLDFFIGFKDMEMMHVSDPLAEINLLPERHRPKLLSRIVTEKLKPDCKEIDVQSDLAWCLQQFLRSEDFFFGLCRLVRHEFYKNDRMFNKAQQVEIFEKLQLVSVFQLGKLETVLMYKKSTLLNTEKRRKVFGEEVYEDTNNSAELCIYFKTKQNVSAAFWINDIAKELSSILNRFLGDVLLKNQMFLPDVLKCMQNPSKIEYELNNNEIMAVEMGQVLNILPFMPELGTEISISLHHLLDNSCTFIETGQYVAYEVYDPIVDEDEPKSGDMPVYILARVIETMTECVFHGPNAEEWNIKYKINVGREETCVAEASRVYKFVRKDKVDTNIDVVDGAVVFHWNIDRVKVYIRDVMRNAFGRTKSEFRRTVKRLLLQYHPDKHTENKDYYENLTKFINFIKERLENGEAVEDADIFASDKSNSQNNYSTSEFWSWCYNRGSAYARNSRDYPGSKDSSHSSFFRAFNESGSQPGQAKRWYKQAEIDFNAASTDQNGPNAYNWACYKCHQAVEKALKALLYQIDADKVSLNTHSLSSLAYSVGDVNLSGLVGCLESITGSYFRMRYPDAVPGGSIPSDLYTEEHARRAIECAQEILQIVRLRITSL
ncbi:sacsin-like [Ostrea edulis]|uniref:sacsin-like n=1 Tax=Ostrea edulis TaxID=37623 RepID=UPI0024AF423A|nr:sacsin-like [Ostrea edulis]